MPAHPAIHSVRQMTTTTTDELLAASTRGATPVRPVAPASIAPITDVPIAPLPIERFRTALGDTEYSDLLKLRDSAQELLLGGGRLVQRQSPGVRPHSCARHIAVEMHVSQRDEIRGPDD